VPVVSISTLPPAEGDPSVRHGRSVPHVSGVSSALPSTSRAAAAGRALAQVTHRRVAQPAVGVAPASSGHDDKPEERHLPPPFH
jgi:hypothetical protein